MPHVIAELSDAEYTRLADQAREQGVTVEQLAEQAIQAGLKNKYTLRRQTGRVVPFQALKRGDA